MLPIDSLGPLQKSKNYIYDFGYRFGYRHQFALLLANYAKLQMVMSLASPLITLSFPYLSWTYGILERLKIRRFLRPPSFSGSHIKFFRKTILFTSSRATRPQTFSEHVPIRKQIVTRQKDISPKVWKSQIRKYLRHSERIVPFCLPVFTDASASEAAIQVAV